MCFLHSYNELKCFLIKYQKGHYTSHNYYILKCISWVIQRTIYLITLANTDCCSIFITRDVNNILNKNVVLIHFLVILKQL